MKYTVWNRALVVLWGVILAQLTLIILGSTHFVSFVFGQKYLLEIIDIAFPLLSAVYSLLLWRFIPAFCSPAFKVMALLLPLVIVFFLYFQTG